MAENRQLTRGRVSKLTGCNIETIRYYERVGLMPLPPRSTGGHRLYDDALINRLRFIRRCRELGFTLEEIRALLDLVDRDDYTCGEVKDISLSHAQEIRRKIRDLRQLEKTMRGMIKECAGGQVPDCPIIDALFDAPTVKRR